MEETAFEVTELAPENDNGVPADVDVPAPDPIPALWAVTDTGYRVVLSDTELLDGETMLRGELPEVYVQRADAAIKKMQLTMAATAAIAPLQDAVDVDMATAEEAAGLLAWKKFRVFVSRVDPAKAPDITWPEQPVT